MTKESRTYNAVKNVKTGAIVQLINRFMAFIVRSIFIVCLNTEYLGVNGLFTNILTVLSFSELGIGTAIIYNMYKPISENDREKIKSLMSLYKKCYYIIGLVVFILGLMVIPFMQFIIKEVPNIKENIILIYILFLFNTASSYFYTFKKSIIIAHQKQSIINNYDGWFFFFKSIIEIIILLSFKNFIIYLLVGIFGTIFENILISRCADKMFPYINDNNISKITQNEKQKIFSNVKSLIVYKFGEVVLTGTDNILISSMISVKTVGLCSNYTMITQAIKSILSSSLGGVTASVGDLNTIKDIRKKENIYHQLLFVNYIIYSFCAICFALLLDKFITIWIGEKYVLGLSVSIALGFSFFVDGVRYPSYLYRTTLGLFSKGKISPYIASIVNILSSIILCLKFGVAGIFIGTSIAQLSSYLWIDPYVIHKYEFKSPVSITYKKYLKYFIIFIIELMVSILLANMINISKYIDFVICIMIAIIVPNILNIIIFHNSMEYKELYKKILKPIISKIKK